MILIDDFVMLGKTVPEVQKKSGRVFVCSAGYSHAMRGPIRVYPLARGKSPPRWSRCRVPLERNPEDSRDESWKLSGDRSPANHPKINSCFEITGEVRKQERPLFIQSLLSPSIQAANAKRKSLCIIEPESVPALSFEENEDSPDHPQISMFEDGQEIVDEGARRFRFQPYLEFKDEGGWHRLQMRGWCGYEWMRKQGDERRFQLAENWRLGQRPCLLVGNMNQHRNVWLIISVLTPIRQMQLQLEAAE